MEHFLRNMIFFCERTEKQWMEEAETALKQLLFLWRMQY